LDSATLVSATSRTCLCRGMLGHRRACLEWRGLKGFRAVSRAVPCPVEPGGERDLAAVL
jgi:hypothetical protein